ncbi:MAG: hypothetical protein KatS3mg043_0195 [Rhodothermaceae bacterium]|nr:MAG: hypothetical protein KatS3mg043_0195 [Rhodothermaceae bacterium]
MHFILDNITASMVLGTVVLSLLFVTRRNQQALVEANAFYSLNVQTLNFTYTLQRDLQNASRVDVVSETDSLFTFRAQTDPADTTRHEVTYRRTKVGRRNGTDLFQILRYVNGVLAGASMGTLTGWQIQGLDAAGQPAAMPSEVKRIHVHLQAITPVQMSSAEVVSLEETDWEATFYPQMMQ